MRAIRLALVLLLVTFAFPASAATYHDPQGKFTLDVPTGWRATPVGGDVLVSTQSAYVRVVNVPGGGKDMELVKRTISQVGAQWQNFKQTNSASATLSGQRGMGVFFTGVNPKGVAALMRIVVAPFGEDAFMLIMSAPKADLLKVQDALKQIEAGFKAGAGANPEPKPEPSEGPSDPAALKGAQTSGSLGGGHMLYGALKDAASASAAFKAGLGHTRGVFDAPLSLGRVVQSLNGHIQMGSFTAVEHGAQVGGLAISIYDPNGLSGFAILYDAPDHLAKSLPLMMKRVNAVTQNMVESARPQDGKGGVDWAGFEKKSRGVSLSRVQFQDGTASIGVATGFTPNKMSGGQFTADAADGAFIHLFIPCPVLDPKGTLYRSMAAIGRNGGNGGPPQIPGQIVFAYDANPQKAWEKYLVELAHQPNAPPNPEPQILHSAQLESKAPGWNGRLVSGTMTWHGEPFVFTATLLTSPPPDAVGTWMLHVTILAAPASHASVDMPAMIAMQNSQKVDMDKVRDQTMRNIAAINEQYAHWMATTRAAYDAASQQRFEGAMNRAAANRKVMDQSTAAFIDYISDQSVVGVGSGSAHVRVSNHLASALEHAAPQHFRVIPGKEYIPGKDY